MAAAVRVAALALCLPLLSCASYSYLAATLQPLPGTWGTDHRQRQELSFLIFGDSGVGGTVQANIGQSMQKVCEKAGCDFALLLGDNIYNTGVKSVDDRQFQTKFDGPYAVLGRLDIWVVPGNHDWKRAESVQAQIAYTSRSDRWRMPHNHFAVPLLPDWIRIYGLDTTVIADLARERDVEKRRALEQSQQSQLAAARDTLCGGSGWKFLFGHHPVYSGGQHGRKDGDPGVIPALEQALLADIIQACGVHAYFAGHDHHQEHIHGPGFEQIIQGAGGRELRPVERLDGPGRSQSFAARRHGFGLVKVSQDTMAMEFYAVGPSAAVARIYGTACRKDNDAVRCVRDVR
jgi:tartrate-resistant acid phosphatase type 5